MSASDIERRLKERPQERPAYEDYVRATAGRRSPHDLSSRALIEDYDNASADYHRYGRWGEENFAIVTAAADRMAAIRREILRRMLSK